MLRLNNYLFNNNTSYEKKKKEEIHKETDDMSFNDIFQIELAKLKTK